MEVLFTIGGGILFAVWHSFCDALAWRIYHAYYSPERKKVENKVSFIFYSSSRCEACRAHVPWYGLIPIAGFFLVQRKCRTCTRPLSLRFVVFETLAFLYGFFLLHAQVPPLEFVVILVAYLCVWIVMTIDYRVLLIPTEAIFTLLVLGFIYLVVIRHPIWMVLKNGFAPDIDLMLDLAVAFLWYAIFHLLRILSGYKMGAADVPLVLALGFLLGHPWAIFLPGLAAFLAIGFYLLRRRSILIYAPSEKQIPFGVFLGMGYLFLALVRAYKI